MSENESVGPIQPGSIEEWGCSIALAMIFFAGGVAVCIKLIRWGLAS